jgi:hypothetical protein
MLASRMLHPPFFEVITSIHANSLWKARAWVVCTSGVFVSLDPFNGVLDYRRVLTGSVPGFGQMLLRTCLVEVHKDIVRCWNFKGEVNDLFVLRSLDLRPHR